jgi:hypothetical protein
MKIVRSLFTPSVATGLTFFGFLLSSAHAAPKPTILIDFTDSHREMNGTVSHEYEYTFGDWGDGHVIDLNGKGTLIQAASGKGGLGENKTAVRLNRSSAIDFIYVIGNANKAASINFAVTDNDGTEFQWTIPLAGKPAGQMLLQHLDLSKPDSTPNAGKTAGLDRKHIASWQVRGDYQAPPTEVLLIKVGTLVGE